MILGNILSSHPVLLSESSLTNKETMKTKAGADSPGISVRKLTKQRTHSSVPSLLGV